MANILLWRAYILLRNATTSSANTPTISMPKSSLLPSSQIEIKSSGQNLQYLKQNHHSSPTYPSYADPMNKTPPNQLPPTTSPRNEQQCIHFSFLTEPGNQVYVTGSFNGWSPDSVKMKDLGNGHYQQSLKLPKGRHEYKFIVNNTWVADPDCLFWESNQHGSLNSVLHVAQ